MMNMTRLFALACMSLALAGCGSLPAPFGRSDEHDQVTALIAYAQTVAGLPSEEQRRELAAANQAYARDRSPYARLKLALLLTTPGTGFGDDARAAGLLESMVGTPPVAQPASQAGAASVNPLRQFAALLYAQINERLREQRRAAQLKEQLDALKAVERNIIERSQGRK
mgnify:CR=1 FL=1